MGDRETPWMHKYGESKTIRIMMATVRHITSEAGCMKFQATWFLLNWVYNVGFWVLLMRIEVIRSITITVNPVRQNNYLF